MARAPDRAKTPRSGAAATRSGEDRGSYSEAGRPAQCHGAPAAGRHAERRRYWVVAGTLIGAQLVRPVSTQS
jgi:hypothetical protein